MYKIEVENDYHCGKSIFYFDGKQISSFCIGDKTIEIYIFNEILSFSIIEFFPLYKKITESEFNRLKKFLENNFMEN